MVKKPYLSILFSALVTLYQALGMEQRMELSTQPIYEVAIDSSRVPSLFNLAMNRIDKNPILKTILLENYSHIEKVKRFYGERDILPVIDKAWHTYQSYQSSYDIKLTEKAFKETYFKIYSIPFIQKRFGSDIDFPQPTDTQWKTCIDRFIKHVKNFEFIGSDLSLNNIEMRMEALHCDDVLQSYPSPALLSWPHLKKLEVNTDYFIFVARHVDSFPQLTNLRLRYHKSTTLPDGIGKLTTLTNLTLFCLGLKKLPSEIGNLTALNFLDLSNNDLKKLPPEIGNLSTLRKLSITANQLTALPHSIKFLRQLHTLFIDETHLEEKDQVCINDNHAAAQNFLQRYVKENYPNDEAEE